MTANRTVVRRGRASRIVDHFPDRPADDPDNVDFWTLFEDARWEPGLEAVLGDLLTSQACFVDVGAWIGPVTLIAAPLCRHVYAVEPDVVAAEQFEANMALSGVGNVSLDRRAVVAVSGPVRIGRKAAGTWGDSMSSVLFDAETREVDGITVERFFDEYDIQGPAVVKVDVEGAEAEILQQAAPFLRDRGAVLLVSLHQPLRSDPDGYQRMIRAALDGFDVSFVDGAGWGDFSTVLCRPV